MPISSQSMVARAKSISSRQQGFTIMELAIVIVIIGLLVTSATIMYVTGARNADYRAATEMLKQDLRKVYSLTNMGVETNGVRDAYRIEFQNSTGTPPNSYKLRKGTWNGGAYNWTDMVPEKGAYNKRVGNWIVPGGTDVRLTWTITGTNSASYNWVTFMSRGAVIKGMCTDTIDANAIMVVVTSGTLNQSKTITVTRLGSINSN